MDSNVISEALSSLIKHANNLSTRDKYNPILKPLKYQLR